MTIHYFAIDGNYGDAEGMVQVDTTHWSEEQWEMVTECSDYDRVDVVRDIIDGNYESEDEDIDEGEMN